MRRPIFIARQAAHPTGILGRALGAIMAIETRALNDEVLRRLAIAPGERILEIGFGHGRTLERAAKKNPSAWFAGIDHASDMVAAAQRRCAALVEAGRFELRAGDSAALPWPDGSFDGVLAVHTLYFWEDAGRHLREIRRVLRPAGRLLLGFRDRTPETEAAVPPAVYHLRSRDEVLALLDSAGLDGDASPGPGSGMWIVEARKR